jgi:K+/H+ antiporter YhaU regulatory subunit KhtT
MGIHRDGKFLFNPSVDEVVKKHDVLLVMGREISLEYFKKYYEEKY